MSGDEGTKALAAMWTLTAVAIVFLLLRGGLRYWAIDQMGADDFVYAFSGVLLVCFTSFMQVAQRYGFGRPITSLTIEEASDAVLYEMIGQTFSVIGMAVSKTALGILLLRLTIVKWHKIAIYVTMGMLMTVSFVTAFVFWLQCRPFRAIFDLKLRPTAKCNLDVLTPVSVTLGVACFVADFFFACFPTLIVWDLKMKKKEKIFISCIMGLGVFAGAAGIVRTYEVATGFTANYTQDTVPLIVWSCAEQVVTMVCIGIPLLRPLYRRVFSGGSNLSSGQYYRYGNGRDRDRNEHELSGYERRARAEARDSAKYDSMMHLQTQTITDIEAPRDDDSDEHILAVTRPAATHKQLTTTSSTEVPASPQDPESKIYVKRDIQIEWTNHKPSN